LRTATDDDLAAIVALYQSAFPDEDGETVGRVARALFEEPEGDETFALVAVENGDVIGHVGFSRTTCQGSPLRGSILAPLGVLPSHQSHGIGSKLVRAGLDLLKASNVDIVFVYGDPGYYGRFGFDTKTTTGLRPDYELQFPHAWMGKVLGDATPIPDVGRLTCSAALADPRIW